MFLSESVTFRFFCLKVSLLKVSLFSSSVGKCHFLKCLFSVLLFESVTSESVTFRWRYVYSCKKILGIFCNHHHHHHAATSSYRSSPLAGLQGYIPYPHIAAVCMFELIILLFPGHMWGSIGVHHLWDFL